MHAFDCIPDLVRRGLPGASADFYSNADGLLVVIQGSGAVRPGVWSRKAVMNEGLNVGRMLKHAASSACILSAPPTIARPTTDLIPVPQIGSILPYLDAAVAAGYSFIVLNPNENYAGGRVRCLALHTAHGQSSPYDGGPCE